MTTKEIVPLSMSLPLASTSHLQNMTDTDLMVIGNAFPGEKLDDESRLRKAKTVVAEFKLYIDTTDNKKGGRDKLLACITQSIAESMLTLASLDLPLTRSLGYAALIPYANVCTVMLQYQGLGELMYRTGTVASIQTNVVYKGDKFDYELGSTPWLKYKDGGEPHTDANLTHAWCICHNKTGPQTIEVMDRKELDKVHKASQNPNGPAWKGWFSQMCRKAPEKRIAKYMQTAVGGVAQTTLGLALDLENSQYNLERMDHYKTVRDDHSRKVLGEANADLDGPAKPPEAQDALPEPEGWISAKGKSNASLRKAVRELRGVTDSSLSDDDYVRVAILDVLGKKTIDNREEFTKVWDDVVNERNRDASTGERIPAA